VQSYHAYPNDSLSCPFPKVFCVWIFCMSVYFNAVMCAVTYAYWLCEKCYCGYIELGKSRQ